MCAAKRSVGNTVLYVGTLHTSSAGISGRKQLTSVIGHQLSSHRHWPSGLSRTSICAIDYL